MKYIYTLIFSSICMLGFSQTISLNGKIVDQDKKALEMVSVVLLEPADSSLLYYGLTNSAGVFTISNVKPGNYILQSSSMGYQTLTFPIQVENGQVEPSISELQMNMESNVLGEIIIKGERIPIIINRDTVAYDAGAFNVGADETAEDLLRRLPGIEVDPDGNITAQGEQVRKVLVDGKEFFGGNVQLATRNLPADAINKVKVYDRKSEDAMFSGVEDGQRDKTIDLELKEDRKKGYFGDLETTIGSDDRYRLKGAIHGFSPTTRLSVLGNTNNLNQLGFEYSDLSSMQGNTTNGRGVSFSTSGAPPMEWDGPTTGVFSSLSSGVNLNYDPSKRMRLNSNYFLAYTDHLLTEVASAREFNNNTGVIVDAKEENYQRNLKLRHQAFTEFRWDFDTNNRIELTINASLEDINQRHRFLFNREASNEVVLQEGTRYLRRIQDELDLTAKLNYIHKFKKNGRTVQLANNFGRFTENGQTPYRSAFNFPQQQILAEVIDQLRLDEYQNEFSITRLTFNEPLTKKQRLIFSYENELRARKQLTNVEDRLIGNGIIDSLSPDFRFNLMENSFSAAYAYAFREENEITFTAKFSNFQQNANDERSNFVVPGLDKNYFLPSLNWYRMNRGFGRTFAGIIRDVGLPGLGQWLVNPDLRDPLFVVEGNPDLTPEIRNNAYFNYFRYNQFSQSNVSFNFNFSVIENPIVNGQFIGDNFERTMRPVNVDDLQYSSSFGTNYRFPVKKLKIFIRTGARIGYAFVNTPINKLDNLQENTNLNTNFSINNFAKGKWEYTVRGNWSMNWAGFSANPNLNQYFSSQNYVGTLIYKPTEKFIIRTEMDYMIFSQEDFGDQLAIPRWNASVSYSWNKSGDLITRITAFDILGRNVGLQRFANANFVRQSETNLLRQYFLFSVVYKFRKQ
jgi:hypothetical protein